MIGVYQQEGLDFFDVIQGALLRHLNAESKSAGFFTIPPEVFNPLRNQYESSKIIRRIAQEKRAEYTYAAGIVDVDIYAYGMNFIFGMADPIKETALVSIHRLIGDRLNERITKEIVHEVGHLMGLGHCCKPHCVMYFSNTLVDTDNKGPDLCIECRREIE